MPTSAVSCLGTEVEAGESAGAVVVVLHIVGHHSLEEGFKQWRLCIILSVLRGGRRDLLNTLVKNIIRGDDGRLYSRAVVGDGTHAIMAHGLTISWY